MKDFKTENRGGEIVLSWSLKSAGSYFLLIFSAFWNLVIVGIVASMISSPGFSWVELLPLIFHILIGVGLLYFGLRMLLNHKEIRVGKSRLIVSQGPLPWFGNKNLNSSDLGQLFVVQSGQTKSGSKVTKLYAVRAEMKSGGVKTIVSSIRSQEKALEIEGIIEKHLNIRDAAVIAPENPLETMVKKHFPDMELPDLGNKPINAGKPGASATAEAPGAKSLPFELTDPLANGTGAILTLKDLDHQITTTTQYDWDNGTTDRSGLLQGQYADGLYSEDRGSRDRTFYEERPLSPKEFLRLGLGNPENLPVHFENGDEKYHQRESLTGFAYVEDEAGFAVKQYIYFTTTSHIRFRVLVKHKEVEVYIQEPVKVEA